MLGSLRFNISVHDFCVPKTKINTYADGNQLHFSHECPITIDSSINSGLEKSLEWFTQNSLKANPASSKVLVPPAPEPLWASKVQVADKELKQENCIKLLGVFIDNKLNFHKQIIANLCCKISRQISVFKRFKSMIPFIAKIKSYNSCTLKYCKG